jgi:hypothetical protein
MHWDLAIFFAASLCSTSFRHYVVCQLQYLERNGEPRPLSEVSIRHELDAEDAAASVCSDA